MADNKKYYYLKLKDNFFETDSMIVLESMQDGYLYSNILMKLYLRSLKNEGKLMFNDRIPFNSTILAQVTRHQVGTVEKALNIFKELDIIEVMDNGAIYMLDIQNFIGQSSSEADRQREWYNKIKNADGEDIKMLESQECKKSNKKSSKKPNEKSTPKRKIEIDKEIEINKKKDIEKDKPQKQTHSTILNEYTQNEDLKSTINDYIEMRKQNKKTMTLKALTLLLNKLDKLVNDDYTKIKMLEQSIEGCWSSVYPLKEKVIDNNYKSYAEKSRDKTNALLNDWLKEE